MAETGYSALVIELVEAFNAGDREALAARLADDAEIRTLRSELEGRPYLGPDGLREAYSAWNEDWEFVRFVIGEPHERDRFVVLGVRIEAKGKASGVELATPIWLLWEFRGEEIVRLRSYSDRDEAFAEAGIED